MEAAVRLPIRPRAAGVTFDAVPRHWLANSLVATHLANGINLLFPAGERFFVRSVRHYLPRIDDAELRAQVIGFFGQEGRHAHAHEEFFDVMEAQGFVVKPFLAKYEKIAYGYIEPNTSHALRLSVTAALEHYTALMAENALKDGILDQAHPSLRKMLMWHASEEIEHKAVAFDVLQKFEPSYALRISGMFIATGVLLAFWAAATRTLIAQEPPEARKNLRAGFREVQRRDPVLRQVFVRGIREYLRRDFHPSQIDNAALAAEFLASEGYEPAVAH